MATGSGMNGKATAEIILEESRPVALSARMHMRILKAVSKPRLCTLILSQRIIC